MDRRSFLMAAAAAGFGKVQRLDFANNPFNIFYARQV